MSKKIPAITLIILIIVAVCLAARLALTWDETSTKAAEANDRVTSASDVAEETKISLGERPDTAIELEWYRAHLETPEQQELYDAMEAAMMSLRTGVIVDSMSEQEVHDVFWAVMYDHPEMFWVGCSYYYHFAEGTDTVIGFDFNYTFEDKEEIEEKLYEYGIMADTIVASTFGDEDELRLAYKWIAHATVYQEGENDQNISSVFDSHSSVCAGYTQALQFICLRAGIPCTRVGGHSIEDGEVSDGNHTWLAASPNLSTLYYYDVTWDDQRMTSSLDHYYAMDMDTMLETRVLDENCKAPIRDENKDDSKELVETAVNISTGEHLEYKEPSTMDLTGLFSSWLGASSSAGITNVMEKLENRSLFATTNFDTSA